MASRPNHPLITDYVYETTLDRLSDIRYPAEYGEPGAPRKSLHYKYGIGNRPMDLAFGGAVLASEIFYNAAGQVTSLEIGPGEPHQLLETFGFDPATGWLDRQQVQRAGAPLLDLSYKYGTHGRRAGQLLETVNNLDGGFTWHYWYDALGRLKRLAGISSRGDRPETDSAVLIAPADEQWSQVYSFDRYGNRTGVALAQEVPSISAWPPSPWTPVPRDGLEAISYDPATNRITNAGFEYDAAGNLTRAPRADGAWQRLQYDAAGRLVRVFDDALVIEGTHVPVFVVNVETYTYGPDRRRLVVERGTFEPIVANGGTNISVSVVRSPKAHERTYYAWDGNAIVAEYTEAEASSWEFRWSRSYVYLGERLLATLTPSSHGVLVRYSHPDRLGTRLVTAEGDRTVTHQITLPYGTVVDADTTATAGRIFASYDRGSFTGLDYAVNRYYDPRLGRFTQVDPFGVQATSLSNPQSWNPYAYVRNDPVNATDPLGLMMCDKNVCIVEFEGGGYAVFVDGELSYIESEEFPLNTRAPDEGLSLEEYFSLRKRNQETVREFGARGEAKGVAGAQRLDDHWPSLLRRITKLKSSL